MSELAVAMEQGRPVSGAISTLASYHYDWSFRHRLLFVRNEIEQGVDVWSALRQASLLTVPEAAAIDVAGRVGNRPWVLRQLSQRRREVDCHRRRLCWELVPPSVVIILGLLVLWIVCAFFLPIVHIVLSLT